MPPPYKLALLLPQAHAFIVQTPISPHPNFKLYIEADLAGNDPSSSEGIV